MFGCWYPKGEYLLKIFYMTASLFQDPPTEGNDQPDRLKHWFDVEEPKS